VLLLLLLLPLLLLLLMISLQLFTSPQLEEFLEAALKAPADNESSGGL
jgi:hypothetical protein